MINQPPLLVNHQLFWALCPVLICKNYNKIWKKVNSGFKIFLFKKFFIFNNLENLKDFFFKRKERVDFLIFFLIIFL